jgi:hypothetical protein
MTFTQRSLFWPALFVGAILLGLWVDQAFVEGGQLLVNVSVLLIFASLLWVSSAVDRKVFLLCLAIAVSGEFFLCQIAGLYTYREGNLPIFVGPGHVLLYATGLWLAKRAPERLYLYVVIFFVPYAASAWHLDFDRFSVVLFALFLLMLCLKRLRNLFSVMFLIALVMEIYGTWMGNWLWVESFPFAFGKISQANPPFASGVLYCGLDFLTQRISSWFQFRKPAKLAYFMPSVMAWTSGTK